MNSRILNFFNVKLDAFIVFVSVVVVIMFIALFFLLLDYLKMRKRYVEFMTGESGKSLEYTIYKRFRYLDPRACLKNALVSYYYLSVSFFSSYFNAISREIFSSSNTCSHTASLISFK